MKKILGGGGGGEVAANHGILSATMVDRQKKIYFESSKTARKT